MGLFKWKAERPEKVWKKLGPAEEANDHKKMAKYYYELALYYEEQGDVPRAAYYWSFFSNVVGGDSELYEKYKELEKKASEKVGEYDKDKSCLIGRISAEIEEKAEELTDRQKLLWILLGMSRLNTLLSGFGRYEKFKSLGDYGNMLELYCKAFYGDFRLLRECRESVNAFIESLMLEDMTIHDKHVFVQIPGHKDFSVADWDGAYSLNAFSMLQVFEAMRDWLAGEIIQEIDVLCLVRNILPDYYYRTTEGKIDDIPEVQREIARIFCDCDFVQQNPDYMEFKEKFDAYLTMNIISDTTQVEEAGKNNHAIEKEREQEKLPENNKEQRNPIERAPMSVKEAFYCLKIQETKDENAIRTAYRKQLAINHPEENPEGFKRLREAMEIAAGYAREEEHKAEEREQTPFDAMLDEAEQIYGSLSRRLNVGEWQALCRQDVFVDLELAENARIIFLRFLSEHYHLPFSVYRMIDATLDVVQDMEELNETVVPGYLSYFADCVADVKNMREFPFAWLEGADDADYDTFIDKLYELDQNLGGENEAAEEIIGFMESLGITHPYFRLSKAVYRMNQNRNEEACEIARELRSHEEYRENRKIQIQTAIILFDSGYQEESVDSFHNRLKTDKEDYYSNYYLARYEREHGTLKEAIKHAYAAYNRYSSDEVSKLCDELDAAYIEKNWEKESELSDDGLEQMLKSYLNLSRVKEGLRLLEQKKEELPEHKYDKYKMRYLDAMEQYDEALPYGLKLKQYLSTQLSTAEDDETRGKTEEELIGTEIALCKIYSGIARLKEGLERQKYRKLCASEVSYCAGLRPKDYRCISNAIYAGMGTYDFEMVNEYADKLLDIAGKDYFALTAKQAAAYYTGNAQDVVDLYNCILDYNVRDPHIYEYAARAFQDHNQWEQAGHVLDRAKENGVDSLMLQAIAYREKIKDHATMKDKDRHLARLEQMIAAETEKKEKADKEALAFLYFLKARVELDFLVEKEGEKTDYSKARNAIDMAIQCFECARYRDVRLDILEKEEDIEAAEVEYELLDEAYGDNLYFAINYARVLRLNRKYEQAIKQLKRIDVQQVQKLEPKFYDYIASELLYLARATNAYYLYGLRNQYLEKYLAWLEEETLENYPEKYKEIDRVVGSIAIGAYRAGDYVKAIHYYRRREKAESTLPYVFYRDLGDAYLAAEDLKNALISYQIALKRVQEDEIEDKQREIRICYRNIATAYAKMQDEAHFDEAAKRACELAEEKDAREAYVADWITYYQDCGNWTKARNILDTYGKKAFDEKTYFKKLIHLKRALISDKKESKELIAFIQKNGDAFGQEFVEDEIMEIEIYDLGDIASHRHQIEQKALKNMEEESLWDARDSILEAMFACRELKLEDKLWFWAKKYLEALEEHYRLTCDMDAAEQFINEPKQRRKNLSRMMTYWGMTGNIQMLEAYVEKLLECLQCAECRGKICTERWGALGFYYEAKGDMEKALEYYRMDAKEAGQFSFSRYRVMNS